MKVLFKAQVNGCHGVSYTLKNAKGLGKENLIHNTMLLRWFEDEYGRYHKAEQVAYFWVEENNET